MNKKQLREKMRKLTTYHSDGGTSGYLLSEKQYEDIDHLIDEYSDGLLIAELEKVAGYTKYSGDVLSDYAIRKSDIVDRIKELKSRRAGIGDK